MTSNLLYLLQIDTPYLPKVFTPYGNGLWSVKLQGVSSYAWGGVIGKYTGLLQIHPTKIGSIRIGMIRYDAVSSMAECWSNPKTYYYDPDKYEILVNVCDSIGLIGFQLPIGRIEIGIIYGYSSRVDYSRQDEAYYDDEYYEPSVASVSDVTNKRDRVFYDNVSYCTVNVELFNHYSKWNGQKLFNRIARLYAVPSGGELSDAVLIHSGVVTKPDISNAKLTFTIDNDAKSLETNIDLGRINTTTFPYYDDDTTDDDAPDDIVFPVAIGKIENFKPTCVNKGETAADNAKYALCKTYAGYQLKEINDVWIQKEDANGVSYDLIVPASGQTISDPKPISKDSKYASVCVNPYIFDFGTGILSVPYDSGLSTGETTVRTSSISDDEVEYSWTDLNVNFFGWYNDKPGEPTDLCGVDLIKIGINVFGGVDYEAWNYDLSAFERERIKSIKMCAEGWACSILVNEDMTITEFLKKVCASTHTTYKLRGDNRYTVKVYENESAGDIKYEIQPEELFDRTDNSSQDTSEVISTAKVTYGSAGDSDNQKTMTDASMEDEIEQTMHLTKTVEFDTSLKDLAGAKLKSSAMLSASLEPPTQSKFTIWANKKNVLLDVSDTITAPRDRANNRAVYNIVSISLSKTKGTLAIVANKIADIEYTDYIQGTAYGLAVCGATAYSRTEYLA